MLRDFPSINAGGSFPTEKLSQGPLKNLIEELEGAEFKSIIEDKFDINLKNAEVITTLEDSLDLKMVKSTLIRKVKLLQSSFI